MEVKRNQVLTIPNLMSLLRLCLIPVFVSLYLEGKNAATAAVLLLSGLTDVADGWFARRFGAVSDLGKALDPVADKLTQAAMLMCLVTRYPAMLVPFMLLMAKELFAAVSGLLVIRYTGSVPGAVWHGKVTTLLLYGLMILHVIWKEIPISLSNILIGLCVAMMILSLVLYAIRNISAIQHARREGH